MGPPLIVVPYIIFPPFIRCTVLYFVYILFSLLLHPNVFDWRAFCYCCNSVVRCVLGVRERIVSLCYQSQRVLPSERLRAMPHWYTGTLVLEHCHFCTHSIWLWKSKSNWISVAEQPPKVLEVYTWILCAVAGAQQIFVSKKKEKQNVNLYVQHIVIEILRN